MLSHVIQARHNLTPTTTKFDKCGHISMDLYSVYYIADIEGYVI